MVLDLGHAPAGFPDATCKIACTQQFEPVLTSFSLGMVKLTVMSAPAHVAICNGSAGRDLGLQMIFQRQGETAFTVEGLDFALSQGGWLLADPWSNHAVCNRTPVEQILVQLPFSEPARRMLARLGGAAVFDAARTGLLRVIGTFLQEAIRDCSALPTSQADYLGQMLHGMVLSLITDDTAGLGRAHGEAQALIERVKSFIDGHLHDADLSVAMMAQAMRCSERHVFKLFAQFGTTPDRYIWTRRLERCRGVMKDPRWRNRSISEIAFAHGFNSSAHFSRAFRSQFGMAPREHRMAE